jgi:PAS domain S-box-containing protein
LFVEDFEPDVELAARILRQNGYSLLFERVDGRHDFVRALDAGGWDAIVCDHGLPGFGVSQALQIVKERDLDIPFVVLSGSIGEEATVETMKAGANAVVLKNNMPRLVHVLRRELAAAADRTARRESERAHHETELRKSAILDSALDCIVTIDSEGRIVDFNRAAERTFGYSAVAVIGCAMADLIIPAWLRERHHAGLAGYLATGQGEILNRRADLTAMRADGTEFPVEIAVVPVNLPGSTLFTAYLRDNTERERLQRQLHQSQRLESLGQLAGGVAHDFNNLLAVILNYATFVAEAIDRDATAGDERWEDARLDVAEISAAAERAVRLTHQLLAFARRDVKRPTVVGLNTVLAELEHLLRRTIDEDITLDIRMADDLSSILADVAQLEQVIVNLAVNARDAMPRGGTLVIETANTEVDEFYATSRVGLTPGQYVQLRVSDTGTGIDKDVINHVFEPFFTTKPIGKGTGLGLSTVYGIVTESGGYAQIYSEPNMGTTFLALFPAVESAPQHPVPQPLGPGPARHGTILVAEDEAPLREVTRRILARNGYEVLVASDGPAALVIARQHPSPIDLLLTDVVMPRQGGIELAKEMAELRPGLRVLYMSGYAQPGLSAGGILTEGSVLIEKPFTERSLIDAVDRVLEERSPAN